MEAIVQDRYGAPERVLRLEEIDRSSSPCRARRILKRQRLSARIHRPHRSSESRT